jgi:perosamine synthetase
MRNKIIPQMVPFITKKDKKEVLKTLNSNWITEGKYCKLFDEELKKLIGNEYGVFAPNGTLALYLGLLALGVGPGDEVIVPNSTFIASANAVILTGATPVFVDINSHYLQMDDKYVEEKINEKTKAIMIVHLYGTICYSTTYICDLAKKYNLFVIEDAAEAIGIRDKYNNYKHAGTFGDVGCFSFFADKTITSGEGGYIICKDEKIYKNLLYLRNQGRIKSGSFIHEKIGYNFRITDMQAALGLSQLKNLKIIKRKKEKILNCYEDNLFNVNNIDIFKRCPLADYIPFRFVIFSKNKKELQRCLKNTVQTRDFFYPLHMQPCFKYLNCCYDEYPNSVKAYNEGLCLPSFPTLKTKQIKRICNKIKDFYGLL